MPRPRRPTRLMAHAYAHLFGLPATGLRFFTVYGPWGRPDMAMWLFTRSDHRGAADPPVQLRPDAARLHLYRRRRRGVGAADRSPGRAAIPNGRAMIPTPATSRAPWRIYNIGNNRPVEVTEVVRLLETGTRDGPPCASLLRCSRATFPQLMRMSPTLQAAVGFQPKTPIEEGVRRFVAWYRSYASARDSEPRREAR